MYTEGVIYSRQRYSLISLILRVVYCQFWHAHTQVRKSRDNLHLTFEPWTSVRITTAMRTLIHNDAVVCLSFRTLHFCHKSYVNATELDHRVPGPCVPSPQSPVLGSSGLLLSWVHCLQCTSNWLFTCNV